MHYDSDRTAQNAIDPERHERVPMTRVRYTHDGAASGHDQSRQCQLEVRLAQLMSLFEPHLPHEASILHISGDAFSVSLPNGQLILIMHISQLQAYLEYPRNRCNAMTAGLETPVLATAEYVQSDSRVRRGRTHRPAFKPGFPSTVSLGFGSLHREMRTASGVQQMAQHLELDM